MIRLLLAFLVAAAGAVGCGGEAARLDGGADGPHGRDGNPVDVRPDEGVDPPQLDAGECSAPRCVAVPPATHRPIVAYDEFVAVADDDLKPYGGDAPFGLFLDSAGVASVGANYFRRLDLDGQLLASSRAPRRTGSTAPVDWEAVVQYQGGYAVIVSDWIGDARMTYLCRITDDVWPDLSACTLVEGGAGRPVLALNGAGFDVLSTEGVATYDSTGALVVSRTPWSNPGEGPTAALNLGSMVAIDWIGLDSRNCRSDAVWLVPATYELAGVQKFDLMPVDFLSDGYGDGIPTVAQAGSSVAFLLPGSCLNPNPVVPGVCTPRAPYWPASFLTVVGPDGQPGILAQPLAIPEARQLIWDGEYLVAADRGETFLAGYIFDLQGTMLRTARVGQELGFSPGGKALGITRLVAVAPNDYMMLYSRLDNGELWVARFQLVPL